MTNTMNAKHTSYPVEVLFNNLRDLAANLRQYGAAMPSLARAERIEAYNWYLAELVARDHSERAYELYSMAADSGITDWGISFPDSRLVSIVRATVDLRNTAAITIAARTIAARTIAEAEQLATDDRMSGPDDTRPHPDAE